MSVSVRKLLEQPFRLGSRKIVRVAKDELHTLVVRLGGAKACLRFEEPVLAADLLNYCDNQLGWHVAGLPFVVDGERFGPDGAGTVELTPSTVRVDVGLAIQPSILEVTRDMGSKG